MENKNLNKIKVSQISFSRIQRAEAELIEIINGPGFVTKGMRDALLSIQSVLPLLEVEKAFPSPTWDGPSGGDAA